MAGAVNQILVTEAEYRELEATAGRRLNLGSGAAPMQFWMNLDESEEWPAEIHAHVPPLPFDDESLDDIYCGHLIEHLTRDEARELVAECYRILTPGGRLGVLVPDTREIMKRYLAGAIDAVEYPLGTWQYVANLDHMCAMFLYSTVQPSQHLWSYDLQTLARLIGSAGFVDLAEMDRYTDPRIAQGAWYQCGIDGYKPKPAAFSSEWPETFDIYTEDDNEG